LTQHELALDLLLNAPLVELSLDLVPLALGLAPELELLDGPLDVLALERPRQPDLGRQRRHCRRHCTEERYQDHPDSHGTIVPLPGSPVNAPRLSGGLSLPETR
jgi:hypothetical protein